VTLFGQAPNSIARTAIGADDADADKSAGAFPQRDQSSNHHHI
jgi:hypothetical protein